MKKEEIGIAIYNIAAVLLVVYATKYIVLKLTGKDITDPLGKM